MALIKNLRIKINRKLSFNRVMIKMKLPQPPPLAGFITIRDINYNVNITRKSFVCHKATIHVNSYGTRLC